MKVVIAGSYAQYKSYLRESGESPQTARFVSEPEQIRGLRGVKVVYYGHWWLNKVAIDPYLALIEKDENLSFGKLT
jgi:hypothetical protein